MLAESQAENAATSSSGPSERLIRAWTAEQLRYASLAVFEDSGLSFSVSETTIANAKDCSEPIARTVTSSISGLHCIGGLDISFPRHLKDEGVATLTIMEFPSLKLLHSLSKRVSISKPYMPSFLAMRECDLLVDLIQDLRKSAFSPFPQVFLVDGNGRFHVRQAGLAVAVGVLADVPTIGCAKEYNPLPAEDQKKPGTEWRYSQKEFKERCKAVLQLRGEWIGMHGADDREYHGAAIMTSRDKNAKQPVFVSPGHKISLESALAVTVACAQARVPEPIRLADSISRGEVRRIYGELA